MHTHQHIIINTQRMEDTTGKLRGECTKCVSYCLEYNKNCMADFPLTNLEGSYSPTKNRMQEERCLRGVRMSRLHSSRICLRLRSAKGGLRKRVNLL